MNKLATLDETMRHFCTFRLEHRLYGIGLGEVREVALCPPMTPVPHAPPAVRGLVNLRSRIYLVLDLRPVLGYEAAACTTESRLVILKPGVAENTAILVDQGGDIVSASMESMEKVVESGDKEAVRQGPAVVTDICKLETGLLMVVASRKVVEHVKRLLSSEPHGAPGAGGDQVREVRT